jgi:uncharacterized delta-60 repeat protein
MEHQKQSKTRSAVQSTSINYEGRNHMKNFISQITGLTRVRARRARKLCVLATVVLLVSWPLPHSAQAAAGDLDLSFGSGGKVVTDFFGGFDGGADVAIQSDGRIIVVGFTLNGGTDFALARYNINGDLDTSFGSGGKVTTDFFGSSDLARAVALDPEGKIVVAGIASNSSLNDDFALARYNTDGSLDTSFGTGGKVSTDFLGSMDTITGLVIQPDGKIAVAGFNFEMINFTSNFALARYNTDGSLDTSFGSGGKVVTSFFGQIDQAIDLTIQPDGRLIAAGGSLNPNGASNFALARYNTDGSLDTSFGSGGKVTTAFDIDATGLAVALQPDGKIVAAGTSFGQFTISDFALTRYNTDGSLDSSFGTGGRVITDFNGLSDRVADLIIQPNGKIVAGGESSFSPVGDFALARYNSAGVLDPSFGNGGKVTTDFPGSTQDIAFGVALQTDGRIVAVGSAISTGVFASDFAIARYNGDGLAFDICLQDDGNGSLFQFNSTTGDYQFTTCSGFTIGGTGSVTRGGGLIALEHNAQDRRVKARITSSNRGMGTIQILSPRITFAITDRNTTNNTCMCK